MDNILVDLLQRRKQHILKYGQAPQTIKLTKNEEIQLRDALKKQTEYYIPPSFLNPNGEAWRSYGRLRYNLEHTDRIFGMQIERIT